MALEDVTRRTERIRDALTSRGVDYALIGGQVLAIWVATRDPDAVRTTKNMDLLVAR